MTIMAVTTSSICENAKQAREMAFMGQYDSASVYYETVLSLLQKLIAGINEPLRKGKWSMIHSQLGREYEQLKSIQKALNDLVGSRLKSGVGAPPPRSLGGFGKNDFKVEFMGKPKEDEDELEREKRRDKDVFGSPRPP